MAAETSGNTLALKAAPPLWEGVTRYHLLVFLGCWMGGIFDGMDSNLFSVMLPNAIQDLAGSVEKSVVSSIGAQVTAVFLLGWMLGGILFGWMGDRLGRVKAMVFSILLYALFTGAAGFAQDPFQLGVCRFLTGLGIGGELVTIATMLSETWPERTRAIAVGSLITSYQVGVLLSGVITSYVHDWRYVFFIGALPALLAIVLRLKMREPEKWLEDQARQQATQADVSPLRDIFKPQHRLQVLVGSVTFGALLIGYWGSLSFIPTWIQDLIGPHALGTEKSIATIYHALGAIAGCVLAGILANALGRRLTIMISAAGSFGMSAVLFLTNTSFTPAIYWQDALLGLFIGILQAVLYIYLPELFPTRLRATAVGFCLNAGRLSTAIAVFFVGTLVAFFGGYAQALLAFSAAYLIGLLAAFAGRETRHQALPD